MSHTWVMAGHEIESEAGMCENGENVWTVVCAVAYTPKPRFQSRLPHLDEYFWKWSTEIV